MKLQIETIYNRYTLQSYDVDLQQHYIPISLMAFPTKTLQTIQSFVRISTNMKNAICGGNIGTEYLHLNSCTSPCFYHFNWKQMETSNLASLKLVKTTHSNNRPKNTHLKKQTYIQDLRVSDLLA